MEIVRLEKGGKPNRLGLEKSPYLLQHAHNPVDWYPWGEEAFARARDEDRPIFLSIGYSTCHWCHVMERESFKDEKVADLLNEFFVCVKVDREERPDIDAIYMGVCVRITGGGGWPLTIFMTPEKKPFWAGTYFPKKSTPGRLGLMDLLPQIARLWETRRSELRSDANRIAGLLEEVAPQCPVREEVSYESLSASAFRELAGLFDRKHGGFGHRPKFPTPHILSFLLRYHLRTKSSLALEMVERTLSAMRQGGIYDHVGFGFHRYSTDERWLVPHFEKMIYDQAMLSMAYTEAYQVTGNLFYRKTAEDTLCYCLRDMRDEKGGFHCAQDADSEGVEGKFYLWRESELKKVLGGERANFVTRSFHVEKDGNFYEEASGKKQGENILHLGDPWPAVVQETGISEEAWESIWASVRKDLWQVRQKRVHPSKDDKVLTDWNGLMISALARASRAFCSPSYAESARQTADFFLGTMRKEGKLLHRYREGDASGCAYLDDYAFLVQGLLDLYETVFEVRYLQEAWSLHQTSMDAFWDSGQGLFYFTARDGEPLLNRPRELYDGAIPSGNSIAFSNVLRFARITGDSTLEDQAHTLAKAFTGTARQAPSGYCQFLSGLEFLIGPSCEIAIVGERGAKETRDMLQRLDQRFIPHKVVLLKEKGPQAENLLQMAPFLSSCQAFEGKTLAYVCQGNTCQRPTSDPEEMLKSLMGGPHEEGPCA